MLAQVNRETALAIADDVLAELSREVTQEAGLELNQTALNAIHGSLR
ncbi:hypothetical protein [Mangrovicoccus ximenensis]|nr:hypothetical protein [Mangrovicoccus ximenensis]